MGDKLVHNFGTKYKLYVLEKKEMIPHAFYQNSFNFCQKNYKSDQMHMRLFPFFLATI